MGVLSEKWDSIISGGGGEVVLLAFAEIIVPVVARITVVLLVDALAGTLHGVPGLGGNAHHSLDALSHTGASWGVPSLVRSAAVMAIGTLDGDGGHICILVGVSCSEQGRLEGHVDGVEGGSVLCEDEGEEEGK